MIEICVASTSFGANLRSSLKYSQFGDHEKWQDRDTYPVWLGGAQWNLLNWIGRRGRRGERNGSGSHLWSGILRRSG